MEDSCIYQFFNNATVATVIAVGIGAWVAVRQYKKQKQIDRTFLQKHEVIISLILLEEKLQYTLFILDRSANTYKKFYNEKDENWIKKFIDALGKYEIPKISNVLNEEIPLLKNKIETLLLLYFFKEKEIKKLYDEFEKELKKWHEFAVNEPLSNVDFFTKKTSAIYGLNIKGLDNRIKKIIDAINKI